jgi:hypothetical protein
MAPKEITTLGEHRRVQLPRDAPDPLKRETGAGPEACHAATCAFVSSATVSLPEFPAQTLPERSKMGPTANSGRPPAVTPVVARGAEPGAPDG